MITPNECIQISKRFEGSVPHFYLDGARIVTIGIGCAIETKEEAAQLELVHIKEARSATRDEKIQEWHIYNNMPGIHNLQYYQSRATLTISGRDIDILYLRTAQNFLRAIDDQICNLDEFKEDAQIVLFDMAYNLGLKGLTTKFPKFMKAFLVRDWETAASECHRLDVQDDRNNWTKEKLLKLKAEKIS